MYRLTKTLFRDLLVLLFIIGVFANGSTARAQTITTVDALWAWDGVFQNVCTDPTSPASISGCFGNMTGRSSPLLATDGTYVYSATGYAGWAYKCPVSGYGNNCTQILVGPFGYSSSNNVEILSIAASGGYLWIGQDDGAIYRCPSNLPWAGSIPTTTPSECVELDNAGKYAKPYSMVIANGSLYVGLGQKVPATGRIWRCDLWTANACTDFFVDYVNSGTQVNSLAVGAGYLWAGVKNGRIWRCDLNNANSCTVWNTAGHQVSALSYDNQGALAVGVVANGFDKGVFWSCPTATPNSCATIIANKNIFYTAAGNLGSIGQHFAAYGWDERQIFNNATPYTNSKIVSSFPTAILYIPKGGVAAPGAVNVSVPLQPSGSSPALTSGSTTALAANSAKLAKLAKRCERGGRVQARVSLEGPHGSVKRNVNLCKYIKDGRPQVNFAALDRGHFYKITARVEGVYGEATFYLDKNDELKDVSIELRRRGK